MKGHSFQSRVLTQLALSIRDIGGEEAVTAARIILSVNEEQQEEVTRMLWDHQFYGEGGGWGGERLLNLRQGSRS